jgi:DNA-binding PadR family transcriptional regulator
MSIPMSLLALLDERPRYGLQLKQEFDARTGQIWPLNVGQVYTTLARLERDGLVASNGGDQSQRGYRITDQGRERLAEWFDRPAADGAPPRDELVLKLMLAAARGPEQLQAVIRSERKAAVETLQEYTRLKRDPADAGDLGWLLLLDSLIFKAESRIRWLDAARARMAQMPPPGPGGARAPQPVDETGSSPDPRPAQASVRQDLA